MSIQNGQRRIAKIRVKTRTVQAAIEQHPLYRRLNSVEALRTFMEHHVYAVWDFMSLLKSLQNEMTCTRIPWRPIGDSEVRRFVNDIVHCEESDKLPNGRSLSHFELYLEAMHAVGADTSSIEAFIELIDANVSVEEALVRAQAPQGARAFVTDTFEVINSKNIIAIGSIAIASSM